MDDDNTISETENFIVWTSADGKEKLYHIEFGGISLHLMSDEWDELVVLIKDADKEN